MERESNSPNRVERALKKLHHMRRSRGDWYAQILGSNDALKQGDLKPSYLSPLEYLDAKQAGFFERVDDIAAILRLGRRINNVPDIVKYVADKTLTTVAIGAVGISRRLGPLPH